MKAFKLSKRSLSNMDGIHPDLYEMALEAIKITNIDFGIPSTGGFRTVEEQKELYEGGASRCDGVRRKSKHQSGRALDFYAYVDGMACWDRNHLTHIAAAFMVAAMRRGVVLEWGGFWKFQDFPHIELRGDE